MLSAPTPSKFHLFQIDGEFDRIIDGTSVDHPEIIASLLDNGSNGAYVVIKPPIYSGSSLSLWTYTRLAFFGVIYSYVGRPVYPCALALRRN